jgi:hypothetical protein
MYEFFFVSFQGNLAEIEVNEDDPDNYKNGDQDKWEEDNALGNRNIFTSHARTRYWGKGALPSDSL